MKAKFNVSLWTWGFLAAAMAAGYTKETVLALLALTGHELAHVFVTLSLGRKISSLTIYPFGGVVRGTDPLTLFSEEEITIAFAGPAWNLFCTALGWLAAAKFNLWPQEIKLWWQINLWMGLINLLPLFPLDGGRIIAAVIFKYWGYKRGISLVSYGTQVAAVVGALYWAVFMHNVEQVHLLMIAAVIFTSAMKERQAAPFIMLRYLLKKNSQFSLRKVLPTKLYAVQEECYLSDIIAEMREDCYYIICGIDRNGQKRFVAERAIIDALVENGGKTKLRDIKEKDFTG